MSNIKETVATPVDLESNTRSQFVTIAVPRTNMVEFNAINVLKCETYNRSRVVKTKFIFRFIEFKRFNKFIITILNNKWKFLYIQFLQL